jgi:hypothetical protein
MLIQFIFSLALIIGLVMTWRRARQEAIRRFEAVIWSAVWIGAGVVIWRPEVSSLVAHSLGIGRGADAILYASIVVLLILVFNLHVAHHRLERKLTDLVREQTLRDMDRVL